MRVWWWEGQRPRQGEVKTEEGCGGRGLSGSIRLWFYDWKDELPENSRKMSNNLTWVLKDEQDDHNSSFEKWRCLNQYNKRNSNELVVVSGRNKKECDFPRLWASASQWMAVPLLSGWQMCHLQRVETGNQSLVWVIKFEISNWQLDIKIWGS